MVEESKKGIVGLVKSLFGAAFVIHLFYTLITSIKQVIL